MPRAVRAPRSILAAALLSLVLSAPAYAREFPPLTGDVVDAAGVLAADSKARIAAWTADFQRETGYRLVVATLPSLNGEGITPVARRLSTEWGIANGVILLEAPNEMWVRIEVGTGLKDRLPDVICGVLLRNDILPPLRAQQLDLAMESGSVAIMRRLGWTGEAAGALQPPPRDRYLFGIRIPHWLAVLFDFAVAGFVLIVKGGGLPKGRSEIVYTYETTPTGLRRTDPGHEDEFIPFVDGKKKKRGESRKRHKGNRKRKRRPKSGASGHW